MGQTLGSTLIAGFAVIVILLTVVCAYSLVSMKKIGLELVEIAEEQIPVMNAVANIEVHQLEQGIALGRAFRFGEEEGAHAEEQYEKAVEQFEEYAKEVDKEIQTERNIRVEGKDEKGRWTKI